MWCGWGLRPDLCGKGLGLHYVLSCIDFAKKQYSYRGKYVRCGVAIFNERTVNVYEKAGLKALKTFMAEICGENLEIIQMKKILLEPSLLYVSYLYNPKTSPVTEPLLSSATELYNILFHINICQMRPSFGQPFPLIS